MERVTGYIEKGRSEGAELVAGGGRVGDRGYFVVPTVFAGGGNGQSIGWINGSAPPDARAPWGGVKTSGVGRELGFAGIEANTEEKTVTITG